MARFSDAQIGDNVYSLITGSGVIVAINDTKIVIAITDSNVNVDSSVKKYSFYLDGRYYENIGEPTLFYLDNYGNRCDKRPLSIPSIDAQYVPKDTLVTIVEDQHRYVKRYFAYKNILDKSCISVYSNGATSSTCESIETYYLDETMVVTCEEIVVNGITYPIGTKVV